MEHFFSTPTATLIQGTTLDSLESMISRLLDKKLASIIEPTPEVKRQPSDGLYRRKEASVRLGVSTVTLDKWTKQGAINARKIGTRVYYTEKDINEALEKALKA